MSSKSVDESCKKLVALGFSKTKAQKALKDSGNLYNKAKEMLERQQQQAEKEVLQNELIKKKQQEDEERKKLEADLRALGLSPASSHQHPSKEAKRQHPCIVQYKSCRYGKFCMLKELPGDVCISHFNSSCIYGSACRNRHSIDGVDIRHYVPNAPNAPPPDDGVLHVQEDGGVVVATEVRGGIVLADVTYPSGHRPTIEGRQLAQAPEYMWNAVRGSEASYSDPLQAPAWDSAEVEEAPTPFLDLAKQQRGAAMSSKSMQKVRAAEAPHQAAQKPVRYGEPGFMGHPCLLQCGGCKYGDACNHATRPADVCVFFLNGRCNYAGTQCRFRHDDGMTMAPASSMAALRQHYPQLSSTPTSGGPQVSPPLGHSSSVSPNIGFVLKSNTVVGGQPMSMWSLGEHVDHSSLERQYAPPQRHHFTASQQGFRVEGSPSSSKLHTLHGLYNVSGGEGSHGSPSAPPPAARMSQEEEGRSFSALMDVFPDVEPGFLLHALRLANGDRSRVADAIASSHANEDTSTLAALLVQEAATEDERLGNATCSSDGLLSLCSVFPMLEPSLIEDALARADGDASSAFAMLVGSAEQRKSVLMKSASGASLSAADQLKVQRLQSMFPDVPPEVVTECFVACHQSTQKAIEGLTHLVEDLKSMEARVRAGSEAMRGSFMPGEAEMHVTDGDGVEEDDDSSFKGSFNVSSSSGGFAVTASTTAALPSQTELYHAVAQEALELGDWRRTRERAYFVNSCRIRVLAMAAAAYANGNGRGAKQLSVKGAQLGAEYRKLNMLAMRALEDERNASHSVSVLDLHGFHVDEAIDVCMRRLLLCQQKSVSRLKMIIGRGAHSAKGKSTVFPAILDTLRHVPQIATAWQVVSVKPAVIEVCRRWGD
jgi:hypothetical protein